MRDLLSEAGRLDCRGSSRDYLRRVLLAEIREEEIEAWNRKKYTTLPPQECKW